MKMFIVRITLNVLPEKRKEFLQTLLSLIGPLEEEIGCLSYDIFCEIHDKNVFSLISEWENRRHLNNHIRSERFGVLLGTKSLLCEPLKIQILTVSCSEGVETVNAVRKKEETEFFCNNSERSLLK